MPVFTRGRATGNSIVAQTEIYSFALAHIIAKQSDKAAVIGQAWLAAPNRLVTCGHVVQPYLAEAGNIAVRFPATGNEYPIDSIQLHPLFYAQDDGIIKHDAAVLALRLKEPEASCRPLPLCFDAALRPQQTLYTIRYLAHLGSQSAPSDPLSQSGHYLGQLDKQDRFHLLHDLALSAGDSGVPLLIDEGVVGVHCGDTASLPGLNVPTTAIRLGLAADALGDLKLTGRSLGTAGQTPLPVFAQVALFLIAAAFTLFVGVATLITVRICLH